MVLFMKGIIMKLWLMDIFGGIKKTIVLLMTALIFQSCVLPYPRYLEYQGKLSTTVHLGDVNVSAKKMYGSKYLYLSLDNKKHRLLTINTDSILFKNYSEIATPQMLDAYSCKHRYYNRKVRNVKDTICSTSERYVRIVLTVSEASDSLYLAPNDGVLVDGNRLFVDTVKVFVPDPIAVINMRMRHDTTKQ